MRYLKDNNRSATFFYTNHFFKMKRFFVHIGFAVLMTIAPALSVSAIAVDQRQYLKDAIMSRSDYWEPNSIDPLISSILNLQEKLKISFSHQHIKCIANGLKDPRCTQAIQEWMHPLFKKLVKLRIINSVREYVLQSSKITKQKRNGLYPLDSVIKNWKSKLVSAYPSKKEIILQGTNNAVKYIKSKSRNPLKTKIVLPMNKELKSILDSTLNALYHDFAFDPNISEGKQIKQVEHFFVRPIVDCCKYSSLPRMKSLQKIEQKVGNQINKISDYHIYARDR